MALAALIFSVVSVDSLFADSILRLSDGTTTVTIVDNGSGDIASSIPGMITFAGGIGEFMINVTTGISTPVVGAPNAPHLDISSLQVTSRVNDPLCPTCKGTGGTLTISFTDTNFVPLAPNLTFFRSTIGGTAGPGVTGSFSTYLDNSNLAFGTGTLLGRLRILIL
jgi:hypothetical protein